MAAPPPAPYAFISYRRADAMAAARGLLRFLQLHFGANAVFMDTAEIRVGDDWKQKIEKALERATVVVPIIGRHWFKLTDEFGRLRIDKKSDWVRREIAYAFAHRKAVLPVYVSIGQPPDRAFPASLKRLPATQGMLIRGEDSVNEWKQLGAHLQRLGFPPLQPDVRYPRATVQLEPFDDERLKAALAALPGWRPVASPVPGMEHVTRSELHARFEFRSFKKAIAFMSDAAVQINASQHHPRWENIWRSVDVYLSTWDVQFQISQLDIDLALHLTAMARSHDGTLL